MKREEFSALLSEGLFLLDGATGSNLLKAGMPRGVSTEAWILENPEAVIELQRAYADAGSQMVYAPTFGCNRHTLKAYGCQDRVEEMNARLVEVSRKALSSQVLVAGDMAPTGMIPEELGGDDDIEDIYDVYRQQAKALYEAGVDLIGCETMMSLDETRAAVEAIHSVCDLPVVATLTYQKNGMTMYGSEAAHASAELEKLGVQAVGLNCSMGPDQLEETVRKIAQAVSIPVIAKPNAGLPKALADGSMYYDMGAEEFAGHMKKLVAAGASVIGGCCGTTPDYIRKLKLMKDGKLIQA